MCVLCIMNNSFIFIKTQLFCLTLTFDIAPICLLMYVIGVIDQESINYVNVCIVLVACHNWHHMIVAWLFYLSIVLCSCHRTIFLLFKICHSVCSARLYYLISACVVLLIIKSIAVLSLLIQLKKYYIIVLATLILSAII